MSTIKLQSYIQTPAYVLTNVNSPDYLSSPLDNRALTQLFRLLNLNFIFKTNVLFRIQNFKYVVKKFYTEHMNKREAQINSDKVIEFLKKERIRQDISITQMAKDIGMSKSSLSYIEHLTQKPALYTVMMMTAYLKVNLSKVIHSIEEEEYITSL